MSPAQQYQFELLRLYSGTVLFWPPTSAPKLVFVPMVAGRKLLPSTRMPEHGMPNRQSGPYVDEGVRYFYYRGQTRIWDEVIAREFSMMENSMMDVPELACRPLSYVYYSGPHRGLRACRGGQEVDLLGEADVPWHAPLVPHPELINETYEFPLHDSPPQGRTVAA